MRCVAFNKPYGVHCRFTDPDGRPTLAGFGLPRDVYPAGRLDHDSEGLVLLTDDGRLVARLLDPERGHPRRYLVQVEGVPGEDALDRLRAGGIPVLGRPSRPCLAERIEPPDLWPRDPPVRFRRTVPDSWIALTLREGRNRQVRRMTAAVGHPTLRLVRTAIGGLEIGDLAPGAWREVRCADAEGGMRPRRPAPAGARRDGRG